MPFDQDNREPVVKVKGGLSHSLSVAEMYHRRQNLIVGCPTEDDSVILPSFYWCFARSAADAVLDVVGWGARWRPVVLFR
jgi:hypothetical protein